jgi:hypothetical protein
MSQSEGNVRWESNAAARVKFALPTVWTTERPEENVLRASSPRAGVGIEFRYVAHGKQEAGIDEHLVMHELQNLVTDAKVTNPPVKMQQHGMNGFGVGGTAKAKTGQELDWFTLVFGDRQGHGIIAFGYGPAPEFEAERPTIMQILQSIQPLG